MKPHQFLGQDIDIPFITFLTHAQSDHKHQDLVFLHAIEDPVTLPHGSQASITGQRAQEWLALLLRFLG